MGEKLCIGVDFGTLSCRAAVLAAASGKILASASMDYPHGVMSDALPDGTPLPADYALQHPADYMEAMEYSVGAAMKECGADRRDVISIGVDFTSCTVLPVKADGTPLCFLDVFKSEPMAYVKLWKQHSAKKYADLFNQRAAERGEPFIKYFGGKISPELYFPKLLETYTECPRVYDAMSLFMEAGDWMVYMLTGSYIKNSSTAGFSDCYHKGDGYPPREFLESLAPGFGDALDKLPGEPVCIGTRAGYLTPGMAERLGLTTDVAVAVANLDSQVAVPATGIDRPGRMLAIMGTSTVYLLLAEDERPVPGIGAIVPDGMLPGTIGYSAGQSCVGDHFAWAVGNITPPEYYAAAKDAGLDIFQYMETLAKRLSAGESGLIALDWWNGNRSILVDMELSGLIVGMTLATRAEHIYRALIEATAFGARTIIENFRTHGIPVQEFHASGGIPKKSPMTMQIYADVLDMPVYVAGSAMGPAHGAAIFGAAAAGSAAGGYGSVAEAARHMGALPERVYTPDERSVSIYAELYQEYAALHDYFGRGGSEVMKTLRRIALRSVR